MKAWYGPERKLWIPNLKVPEHLTGEYPGDYGFDPLNLAAKPDDFAKYREAEVLHGRWAMLAIVGCLVPEALNIGKDPVWFKAGGQLFEGGIDYLGNPELIHAQNAFAIVFFQILLMGTIEAWRWNITNEQDLDRTYPGGYFDPLGFAGTGDKLALQKVKEVKNGRLAMVSIFGYYVQAFYTGVGPIENWTAHLANPFGTNVLSTLDNVAMFASSGMKAWYGPERKLWIPNLKVPEHLTGEYPGDYGFDPLNLAAKPDDFAKYREAEVLHGRWAMLAIVGCLVPEALNIGKDPVWFKAGGQLFEGGIDYLGNPELIHAQNAFAIVFFQILLMGTIEAWRWNITNEQDLDRTYPGGYFDPLGFAGTGDKLALQKVKEVKNGRLAMVSIFGYYVQAFYTGVGPIENWTAHLANPFGTNILSTLDSVAMF